jgi:GDP-L-fucose synthase
LTTLPFDLAGKRVWVAGHRGLVGSALVRRLQQEGCTILTADRAQVDLTRQAAVEDWLAQEKPDVVFMAAARVGGIQANNTRPAEFLYENLAIETNVLHGAYKIGVQKLIFLGSSCIYPRMAQQPMDEAQLLTGPLEPTNEWYALAKIAGIKICDAYRRQYGADFISVMPTNLYGPGDNFDTSGGHVLPALMRRFHEAKQQDAPAVSIWGSGTPLREFLYVDDLADGVVFLAKHYSDETHVNIGTGEEIAIADLARLVRDVVGYQGALAFDPDKPDGTPRKIVDTAKLAGLGWTPSVSLKDGVRRTYDWLLAQHKAGKPVNGWPVGDPAGLVE